MLEQDPAEAAASKPERSSGMMAKAAGPPASAVTPQWAAAARERLRRVLEGSEPEAVAATLLDELAVLLGAAQGAAYLLSPATPAGAAALVSCATHASPDVPRSFALGEGLIGQAAVDRRKRVLRGVPAAYYRVSSALGSAPPSTLVVVPVCAGARLCVLELGFVGELAPPFEALLDELASQASAAGSFAEAPSASGAARSSAGPGPGGDASAPRPTQRYGFWGKLSHELRSPLNSVLVLSKLLAENADENLSSKQIAFAKAIHRSGTDLLALVNTMSDLSKIESNRLVLEPSEMSFEGLRSHLERAFASLAQARGLTFSVQLDPRLPPGMLIDVKRLRQIIKCLLSNAFKFTESGSVAVNVSLRSSGWSLDRERLNGAAAVVAFAVSDTGIGMSESEQRSLLEVFPPEHVEARREAGASGFGLAISRELARCLGGELQLESALGRGSTFTLFLPLSAPTEGCDSSRESDACSSSWPSSASAPPTGSGHSWPDESGSDVELDPSALSGLEIMLVEDDVRSAYALTGLLERQGAAVSHAEDVEQALARLDQGRGASALLIDAELLTTGSEDSLRHILERCGRLPIIALTRSGENAGEDAAVPPRVHQLQKPVDPRQLVSVLRTLAIPLRSLQTRAQ